MPDPNPAATPPISIPAKLKHDRAIRRLLTAWLNAHARFAVCAKRLNWKTPQSRKIEKSRRKEKWVCVARILDIEHTVLRWLASGTHHPDLWTSPSRGKLSRRNELRGAYYRQRMHEARLRGDARKAILHTRTSVVGQIRMLDRQWMLALLAAVYPNARVPDPLPLHPRELLPRKIASASRVLVAEIERPRVVAQPRRIRLTIQRLRQA